MKWYEERVRNLYKNIGRMQIWTWFGLWLLVVHHTDKLFWFGLGLAIYSVVVWYCLNLRLKHLIQGEQ